VRDLRDSYCNSPTPTEIHLLWYPAFCVPSSTRRFSKVPRFVCIRSPKTTNAKHACSRDTGDPRCCILDSPILFRYYSRQADCYVCLGYIFVGYTFLGLGPTADEKPIPRGYSLARHDYCHRAQSMQSRGLFSTLVTTAVRGCTSAHRGHFGRIGPLRFSPGAVIGSDKLERWPGATFGSPGFLPPLPEVVLQLPALSHPRFPMAC